MQLSTGVTGTVPKQTDSLEQVTFHYDPLIWCIYQMDYTDKASMPLKREFIVISTNDVPKQKDSSELAAVYHGPLI